ncbi:GNAT family N-acetyltransferase [Leptospira terpstrae]|uniref:GNAT family N-acetyltransferase n=1 Tax=Leptospira terpstrae TaxID=293075 RepID=UPI001E2FE60A|nr:GNAT family N-acetyltransferase [Leptospira terpstrae]
MVYTVPEFRQQGIGAKLCRSIEVTAKDRGIKEIYLFSDTAVSLYNRFGWTEAVTCGHRTVMKKEF